MKKGKVYLIGAGPAGKDLITVKGLKLLQRADVIVYDYLTDKSLLSTIKPGAQSINCRDLGKLHGGDAWQAQAKINALMVAQAQKGKVVVRLKNGDPFIFSRISEEMQALRENKIAFEVIPGVTAAQAAVAFLCIPFTDRNSASSVVFVTGHETEGKGRSSIDWKNIAANGTIVLYMGVTNISKIVAHLIKAGKSSVTPVAAISHAGQKNQKVAISRLKDIPTVVKKKGIVAPTIFIIGETVKMH